ncbi:hypothetical protein Pmar_PMAR012361 [Perkinsus marinus ATCC 50983]|uniref:Uncharacterized protein n=1 Tax=Perkinsus marinus (strain ATCC 50983 / TXsc) TaxID=423536 RepID=C5K750_PERM5|nr:hypothetical protein Pmar_PMAR012361 [Perkinsus marinus ATCC 50983]EER19385.1 hypothetical protein Pmar_PMAR012361 [Perkinsus marinus ATCC 50983]|eukprot:XP_002787589.1 hypothetical protein Pmar_PMAR012361 [Perkinsus marinus ATCC 50983]
MEEGAIDHTKAEEAEGEFSLYSLFKRGLLTDCILVVPREKVKVQEEEEGEEDEEEEEGNSGDFKLHKLILASYSRYCYKKIIPSDEEGEEEEGEEEGDAVVVPEHQQDEGVHTWGLGESYIAQPALRNSFSFSRGVSMRAASDYRGCSHAALLGLTLALEMPSLAHRLAEYILSTCLNPHTAPAVLLRCSYYTDNNADAKALAEAAEALLLDKFDECIQPRLGKPLRVYELSQLPLAMIERILTSDKLGLGASSGDEELVLRTCTNVLRQRMDRRHIRVGMEMVKPLSGAVEVKLRVMEGIASGSECVRGDPVPRYERAVSWGEGEEGRIVEGIVPLLDEAPLGEVWAEVEWKLSSGEVIVDELSKEVFQKPQQEEDEEEDDDDGKEVSLHSGAVVRVTLRSEEPVQEPEKDSGESGGDEDVAEEEEGEDDEDSSSPKKEGVWEKEDFEMVYGCVRWSQLPLESLISAAESPLWRPAQDRILELMRKFTTTGQQDLPIGGRPRECQKEGYKRRQEMKEEVEVEEG